MTAALFVWQRFRCVRILWLKLLEIPNPEYNEIVHAIQ